MATLITFTGGTPILSADVNTNFAALNTEIAASLRAGYASAANVSNILTGEDPLHQWTMPASRLEVNGGALINAWGSFGSNANTKTLRLVLGSSSLVLNPTTAAPNAKGWYANLMLSIYTATEAIVSGTVHLGVAGSGASPAIEAAGWLGSLTVASWAVSMVLGFTGQGTNSADIVQGGLIINTYTTIS